MDRATNAEIFLQKYRVMEGLLEKRYEGMKLNSSSVVIEYLRDDDSRDVRVDLDLLRGIRNILSHNADADGAPVIEPSAEMIARLENIIRSLRRPRSAADFGTPAEKVLSAHPNDRIGDVMRNMSNCGYSHVPITEGERITGVFSIKCLFDYLAQNGLDALHADARIRMLGDATRIDGNQSERYRFVSGKCSIITVRCAFQENADRNQKLNVVFVTQSGAPDEPLLRIITPWDLLDIED